MMKVMPIATNAICRYLNRSVSFMGLPFFGEVGRWIDLLGNWKLRGPSPGSMVKVQRFTAMEISSADGLRPACMKMCAAHDPIAVERSCCPAVVRMQASRAMERPRRKTKFGSGLRQFLKEGSWLRDRQAVQVAGAGRGHRRIRVWRYRQWRIKSQAQRACFVDDVPQRHRSWNFSGGWFERLPAQRKVTLGRWLQICAHRWRAPMRKFVLTL